jgi:DNA-binding CsgD family transcriptional regulator
MSDRRPFDLRILDVEEQGRITRAVSQLGAVPLGGRASAVFDALRVCAPVVGGLIGVMGAEISDSTMTHVVGLPTDVLEGWATTPREHLGRMMAPLFPAAPGQLISDRSAITGSFRDQLDLLRVLHDARLGESAGYKVSARRTIAGRPEHRFLTIALDDGRIFGPAHHDLFLHLQPAVQAALARLDVPLIAAEPIFAQILGERRTGYLCLSRTASIVELNARAHSLVATYARSANVEPGRGSLDRFVQRVLVETLGGRSWRLLRADGAAQLEITTHRLAKEVHAVGEDLTLVMLSETELAPTPPPLRLHLTERQLEVARLLAETDDSYKEIANRLRIAEGTLRKHVEKVYRAYGVRSRVGLAVKVR